MQLPKGFLEGEIREGFYVESMMKRVWAAQIEVLHDVDYICKKHNIQYFADWGTLLGAVRHKGFVPWDDDMDITMKRPDYIKFCEIAPHEMKGYDIVNIHTDLGWDMLITRIVNGKVISYNIDRMEKYHGCPWVIGLDIFPLDYVAPTEEEDEYHCQLQRIVEVFANTLESGEHDEEKIRETALKIEEMFNVKFDYEKPLSTQLLKLAERLSMMYTEEESDKLALMPDHIGPRPLDVYPKEYYSDTIEMPFEYTTIPVPVGYDAILRQKYGDNYMQPIIGASSHQYPFYMKQKREYYGQLGIKI